MSVIIKGKNVNKPYTVRFWVDGKQRERSFATRKEAQDFKIKTDHDVRAQIFIDDKLGKQNFGETASSWLDHLVKSPGTKKTYKSVFNAHVLPAFGSRTISDVARSREEVSRFLNVKMGHLSISRRTIARYVITGVLDEAVKSGKIPGHKLSGIELEDGGRKNGRSDFVFPTHDQLTQVADNLGDLGLTIWLMRGCGLRIAEALAVRKDCFMDGGKTLRIHEQLDQSGHNLMPLKHRKADEYRDIPVPGYVWEMTENLPDGYLFGSTVYNTYNRNFKEQARLAGISQNFTPHSLRHAFVSALLAHGVPITEVAIWLGHRDISVTFSIYGHLVPSAASRAVSVLDKEYEKWSSLWSISVEAEFRNGLFGGHFSYIGMERYDILIMYTKRKDNDMREKVCFTLRPETLADLKVLAEKEDMPASRIVDKAIRQYLDQESGQN